MSGWRILGLKWRPGSRGSVGRAEFVRNYGWGISIWFGDLRVSLHWKEWVLLA